MKKYRTITVYTREGIDNLMDFDEIKRAALREGSLSRALNDLLEKVLEAAKSVNFKPSNELGLGDLWAYLTDLDLLKCSMSVEITISIRKNTRLSVL